VSSMSTDASSLLLTDANGRGGGQPQRDYLGRLSSAPTDGELTLAPVEKWGAPQPATLTIEARHRRPHALATGDGRDPPTHGTDDA